MSFRTVLIVILALVCGISPASGGSGLILPGNKVDVLLIPSQATIESQTGIVPVLQNVEVWAVGSRLEAPSDNKLDSKELKDVTLLVTPDQATTLAGMQNTG